MSRESLADKRRHAADQQDDADGGSSSSSVPAYDVVIVGAGLAGLVTGYELRRRTPTLSWCIVERAAHFGGPANRSAARWPLLGDAAVGWFSADQQLLLELCGELAELSSMPAVADDAEQRTTSMLFGDAAALAAHRDWDIDRGAHAALVHCELRRFVAWMDDVSVEYYADAYTDREARGGGWPLSWSMESVLCARLWFAASRQLVRMLVRWVSGCAPTDVTFCEWMLLCQASGGATPLLQW